MTDKLIAFFVSIFLLILMTFFTPEELRSGFFYYLLITILTFTIISYSLSYVLNKFFEGLDILLSKIIEYTISFIKKIRTISISSLFLMLSITFGWLSFIIYLILKQKGDFDLACLLNIKFDGLTLNEWGDFSAGFVAPLALGWLAYSIYYQKKEFENVHVSLKDQILELEIEKHYTSYEQYTDKMDDIILNITNEMNVSSLSSVNEKFSLVNTSNYINIAAKVKKLYLLNKNIYTLFDSDSSNERSSKSLNALKKQYLILYKEDIEALQKILLKYLFLISLSDQTIKHEEPYKDFKELSNWLSKEKKDKILTMIKEVEESMFSKKIDPAFNIIEKEFKDYLDWLEGEI